MTANPCEQLNELLSDLKPLHYRLNTHPLYSALNTLDDLHIFMETHVFAVWDFMSLLKVLQNQLTCREIPWIPNQYPKSARFINEIVIGEETDQYGELTLSHFEIYLLAMKESGASLIAIQTLLYLLNQGQSWHQALANAPAPQAAKKFVEKTFSQIQANQVHAVAAAFTFGREDIIPEMFREFIAKQNTELKEKLKTLHWYFDRHISLDGDEHGPMALEVIKEICGTDLSKWQEAKQAAAMAIQARIELWDDIYTAIKVNQMSEVA